MDAPSPASPPALPSRVVVVDDDELIVRALSRIMELAGFEPRGYQSPQAALEQLEADAPVVIIADYMMPGMDGIQFLKQARQKVPGSTRILCTAAEDFRVALEAVNSGEVYRIVAKPWHQGEVVQIVKQAAESARLRAENERLNRELRQSNGELEAANGKLQGAIEQLRGVNVRLEEMVKARTGALLEGLISALDYRDAETQWHSRRVSLYARRLAQAVGVRGPELDVIEHGSLLHDIGKIGVRDHVLLKPGPLTPEEWDEMKRHPELGWALCQRVDYLKPSSVIVLQHQEKWDGTGYPSGLKGEHITLGARIFHIVDTLDAITSDRPYRKAKPLSVARAEIQRCAGTQFDPKLVEAFMAVPDDEWERIRLDVEQAAMLSADLAEIPKAADGLIRALRGTLPV